MECRISRTATRNSLFSDMCLARDWRPPFFSLLFSFWTKQSVSMFFEGVSEARIVHFKQGASEIALILPQKPRTEISWARACVAAAVIACGLQRQCLGRLSFAAISRWRTNRIALFQKTKKLQRRKEKHTARLSRSGPQPKANSNPSAKQETHNGVQGAPLLTELPKRREI